MVDPLLQPPRKNPIKRSRVFTPPPQARSRAALFFSAYAARGQLRMQKCDGCGAIQYPPRDACSECWSDALCWRKIDADGEILSETSLNASTNVYFRERLPWRVGAVKMMAGPVVAAHLHSDVATGDTVRLIARTDKSGQGVLMALPKQETNNMADDKALRALTCDPKHRRVLVSDVRTPMGQAMVRAAIEAGAAKVFLGVATAWKPFTGQDELFALKKTEVAPLDLADGKSVTELAASIGGKTDILINTAQYVRPGSVFDRRDVSTAKDEMEINFFGALRTLQAFGPIMRNRSTDSENGAVAWVNCISAYAFSDWPRFGVNGASQAAALALAQNARAEFAGAGVKVVNAFHGPIDDEWSQELPPPKVAPKRYAAEVMTALREGIEEIHVGDIARDIHERWRENPAVLERELTAMKMMD